jgi:kinesin family protein C2/C3
VLNKNKNLKEVFDEVSLFLQNILNENNISILAYGQTCTGKTYSIEGPSNSNPGVFLRTIKELFKMMKDNNITDYKISVTIIEIYNETIYNLLNEDTPSLNIYENSNGNLIVPDLKPIIIKDYEEAAKLLKLTKKFRTTNYNDYHGRSSRSHCVYTIYVKYKEEERNKKSKISIVDLAGSERLSKSTYYDEDLHKETISINLSLNSLANVLNALSNKQGYIPYRDSKLTHYLKDCLTESFNILLMLHLSPNIKDLQESISTLEFGVRVGKLCKNKTIRDNTRGHTRAHSTKIAHI